MISRSRQVQRRLRRAVVSVWIALPACSSGDTLTSTPNPPPPDPPDPPSSDVTVATADPLGAPRTTTLNVRVLGSGYDDGSRAVWALDGDTSLATTKIRTNSTAFVSDTELVANITIEPDAPLAVYDIAIETLTGKKGLGLERFAATDGIVELRAGANVLGEGGMAEAINDKGQIVGSGGTASGAFLWDNGAIIGLAMPPGMRGAEAMDINGSGIIVGAVVDGSNRAHPVRWNAPDQPELLNTGLDCCGEARAINDDGVIAGAVSSGREGDGHAVIWDVNGRLHPIQTIVGGESFAWDINASGEVVGQWNGPTHAQAFRYTAATGMVLLPALRDGFHGVAIGINRSGQVVGWSGPSSSTLSGTLWDGSSVIPLGTLGGPSSVGTAITDDGRVVGRADLTRYQQRPFLWTATDGMRNLGLPPGSDFGQAEDINVSGFVVGVSSWPSGVQRATLWLPR
jgi:probable HAF family extracellular repeat protein